MRLFRVCPGKRAEPNWRDAFSGLGSYYNGGRWSSPGTKMVYVSTHLSLATLEVLVHANKRSFQASLTSIEVEISDDLISELTTELYPKNWNGFPARKRTKSIGDGWCRSPNNSTGLMVASATLPNAQTLTERNVLLNPNVPGFLEQIDLIRMEPFAFDARIQKLLEDEHQT